MIYKKILLLLSGVHGQTKVLVLPVDMAHKYQADLGALREYAHGRDAPNLFLKLLNLSGAPKS